MMIWANALIWITAFSMSILGGVIFVRTGMVDFKPWKQAKRKLTFVGILMVVPGIVLVFYFLPIPLAFVASIVLAFLGVLHFTMIAPDQWRRVVGKRD